MQLTKNGMGYLMNLSLLTDLIKGWEGVILDYENNLNP